MPAFSKLLNVSTHVSNVSSCLFQPSLRALLIDDIVGQAFPIDQSKNPQVPQSMASLLPPYLSQICSHTGFLSLAHSAMLKSLA